MVRSCCNRRCSEDYVLAISRAFSASYGSSAVGEMIMSRISEIYSGEGGDYVLKLYSLAGDSPGSKNGVNLGEPGKGVCCQIRR